MIFSTHLWWLLAIVATVSNAKTFGITEHHIKARRHNEQDGKYLIYIPESGHMQEDLEISASVFNATKGTHLTIGLQERRNHTILSSVEYYIKSEESKLMKLPIPFLMRYNYGYEVVINATGGVEFNATSPVWFSEEKTAQVKHRIFVQTDKPVYKPLDKIRFRVFGIHADLRAANGSMNITMIDPHKNVMYRWFNETPETGVSSHEYELSDKPIFGEWYIEIHQDGKKERHHFEVKEYVLPNYKVEIHGDRNISSLGYGFLFLTEQHIKLHVTAKYTFGKAVKGTLFMNATVDDRYDGLTVNFTKEFNGDIDIDFNMHDFTQAEIVRLSDHHRYCTPDKIIFRAMVIEALTGKKMYSEPFSIEIINAPIKLDIDTPIVYKRGLPKRIKVQIHRVDGEHLSEEDRKIPLEVITKYAYKVEYGYMEEHGYSTKQDKMDEYSHMEEYSHMGEHEHNKEYDHRRTHRTEYQIPENGTVFVDFWIPSHRKGSVSIDIKYRGHHNKTVYEVRKKLHPEEFHNEHKDNIDAMLVHERVNMGDDIKVHMNSTTPISWAIITTISHNSIISNKLVHVENKTDFMLEFPSSEMMIPSADVLISCITSEGKLMVDASTAKITITFHNDVVGTFTQDEGQPGTNVDFKVKTMPGSAVFVMAVDKKLHLLEEAKYITEDMVYDALVGHDTSNTWRRNIRNVHEVIDSVDLNMITNYIGEPYRRFTPYSHKVPIVAHAEFDAHPAPIHSKEHSNAAPRQRIRSFFPETWIWEDGKAADSGEYAFSKTVPDSITTWQANAFAFHPEKGLGIMKEPVDFLSHQDFFIHPDLPYSLIRGETFILQVSIFSNFTKDQEVTVTLPESTQYQVKESENPQKVMVLAHQENTVQFEVVPTEAGEIPIKIQASCELASDEVHKNITVKPEGYTQYRNKAFLLKVSDETPMEMDYEFTDRPEIVPDSERIEVSVIGDLMGPTIESLGHLIRIPSGCGEQNMINFAPNVYIYNYLNETSKLTPEQQQKLEMYTIKGFKNQMKYQLNDGSYSAFGKSDKKGSTWLTAFVLRCFGQARKSMPALYIDEHILHDGVRWLVHKRNERNLFEEEGRVIHSAMQGGTNDNVTLSTYVLISLFENHDILPNVTRPLVEDVANHLPIDEKDTYSLAMMMYLMALLKDTEKFNKIETILEGKAIVEDDMKHWKTENTPEEEDHHHDHHHHYSASTGIELSSYILMAYTEQGMMEKAMPVMKWLMSQRNSFGGFHSTQDTILGLEALSKFAAQVKSPASLTVTFTADEATTHEFPEITPLTSTILNKHVMPADVKKMHIKAVGKPAEGATYTYALAQISWQYNVKFGSKDEIFEGKAEYKAISSAEMELHICHKMKEMNLTGMIIIEAALPSGYSLTNGRELLAFENISKVEMYDFNVVLYLNELHTDFECYTLRASKVHEIHGHLSPLPVKISLYYQPDLELVTMYQVTGGSE